MKTRNGFVSNSSSTSFMIKNKSNVKKTLVEFVIENPDLVEQFCSEYNWNNISQYELLHSAKQNDFSWEPGEEKECVFGDEDGTIIGEVFDYILRDGGESESFSWRFNEYYR